MAGAGFKTFNTGDVLLASEVNTYLQQQTVMVFASSTARTTALSGVLAEGMMSYLQDTNSVEVYNGSSWVNVGNAGDITGVTAGTGISGGGSSGDVTITNSMATAIDAKGDLIVGTGADTFSRLAVGGTNGHVLTVDSGEATGMKWAAAGGGGATWANYTPTWTNLTVGNGTNSGRYIQIEKVVFFNAYVLFGSTTSVSGGIEVSVPVTAGSTSALAMGNYTVMVVDDGVGNWFATVNTDRVNWTDTGKIRLIPWKANDTYLKFDTNFSSTVPFTWATSDRIMVAGYYEVA